MKRPRKEILVGDNSILEELYDYNYTPIPHTHQALMESIIEEDLNDEDRELYYMRFGERLSIRTIAKRQGYEGHQIIQYKLEKLYSKIRAALLDRGLSTKNI